MSFCCVVVFQFHCDFLEQIALYLRKVVETVVGNVRKPKFKVFYIQKLLTFEFVELVDPACMSLFTESIIGFGGIPFIES